MTSMQVPSEPLSSFPSVRQLRALVAVYNTGSVSAAAQHLALTQPAVTVLLRELEHKLGVKLFDRSTRTLRRTDAAVHAVDYAERVLGELSAMTASMAKLSGAHEGRVRITTTAAVAQVLLPPVVATFLQKHPAVKVEIEEVAPGDFVEALMTERTDFGVGTLHAPVPWLREEVLAREQLVAAALPSNEFQGGTLLTWKQLAALPLVTVRSGYGVRGRIEAAARDAGVTLRIEHEVSLMGTAIALAASGLGVIVAPPSILRNEPRLVTRRLTRPSVERVLGVIWKSDRSLSPAAEAFLAVMRSTISI